MTELTGKVALVTGGSRGIGAAIAQQLAEHGANVAITYANSADRANAVIAELPTRGVAIKADSADPREITDAVHQTAAALGGLDILVNNAGIFPSGPVEETTLADVDRTLAIHARAAYLASQAALQHMPAGGRIVSIGSNLAERVPFAGVTLYSMSKSALIGFTRGLARDVGDRGITVNLVQPGATDTDMNPADGPGADHQRTLTALGSYAEPNDVAATVAFLAGPGGRTITGSVLTVDGGSNA